MKEAVDTLLRREQAHFLESLLSPRDDVLAEMEAEAEEEGIPVADPEVGRLLTVLARLAAPRRIVEIGCAIGYGALCLARGAPGARIWTVDRSEERLERARFWLERAGVADRVELACGEAVERVAGLEPGIDLAWIDADKESYPRYLELLSDRLAPGGLLVADNVLWKGKVARGENDPETDAVRRFDRTLAEHSGYESVFLPLGDGVAIAVRRR